MIRDPSDGSVREKPVAGKSLSTAMPVPEPGMASALSPIDAKELEKLNKSREWLKQYHKAVDDVNRMNDKGEIPQEGDIGK